MHGINNSWGMGFGYGWIIGLIFLVVIVWLLLKIVNNKKK